MEQIYPKRNKGFSGQAIRLAAICAMLCDHIWVTIAPEHSWLTYIGRIAFPLFAFLVAITQAPARPTSFGSCCLQQFPRFPLI